MKIHVPLNFSILLLAVFATPLTNARNSVDFRIMIGIHQANDMTTASCLYPDALKNHREGTQQVTLALKESFIDASDSDHSPVDSHRLCMETISRETLLHQTSGQNDVGEILNSMQCKPGTRLKINAIGGPYEKWMLNGTKKRQNLLTSINIFGCLEENAKLPEPCKHPSSYGVNINITHDDLIKVLRRCRDAVNKLVADNNLLERWKNLDKDGKPTSGQKHESN